LPNQALCIACGVALTAPRDDNGMTRRVIAGILAILLGSLGIHKFYLGYNTEGIIMLLVSVVTCGIAGAVMHVIGIIEGILYLTKTEEEFDRVYVTGRQGWF